MSVSWMGLASVLAEGILRLLSPHLHEKLVAFLQNFYVEAVESDGPWDDLAARVLLAVVGAEPPPQS